MQRPSPSTVYSSLPSLPLFARVLLREAPQCHCPARRHASPMHCQSFLAFVPSASRGHWWRAPCWPCRPDQSLPGFGTLPLEPVPELSSPVLPPHPPTKGCRPNTPPASTALPRGAKAYAVTLCIPIKEERCRAASIRQTPQGPAHSHSQSTVQRRPPSCCVNRDREGRLRRPPRLRPPAPPVPVLAAGASIQEWGPAQDRSKGWAPFAH